MTLALSKWSSDVHFSYPGFQKDHHNWEETYMASEVFVSWNWNRFLSFQLSSVRPDSSRATIKGSPTSIKNEKNWQEKRNCFLKIAVPSFFFLNLGQEGYGVWWLFLEGRWPAPVISLLLVLDHFRNDGHICKLVAIFKRKRILIIGLLKVSQEKKRVGMPKRQFYPFSSTQVAWMLKVLIFEIQSWYIMVVCRTLNNSVRK